jgi:DMSO/TMAO reductase YedYZ molybdopterin-dependent catalytic subunit
LGRRIKQTLVEEYMKLEWSRRRFLIGAASILPGDLGSQQIDFSEPDQVFARDHFNEPDLSLTTWTLRIDGNVSRPVTLTFSDLLEAPCVRQNALFECAGNGEAGSAVAMCVWSGVRLSRLLNMVGANKGGSILLEGSDQGQLVKGSISAPYTRIVPARKCWAPESLVAFKLNDRFLPKRSGFPARVVLPGWYGMDSVKWIRRISVLDSRRGEPAVYSDSGMNRLYSRLTATHGPVRLSSILVKSVISYPDKNTKLVRGNIPVSGYAWTGDGVIKSVQVSVDGGRRWDTAKLETSPLRFAWVRWTYNWKADSGEHVLMSRAEDSDGKLQPLARDSERLDYYELNWVAPVRCSVK